MTNKMAGEQEVGGCRVSTAQGSRGAAPVLLCGDVREGAKGGAAAARGRRGRGVGAVEERQGAEVRGCRVPLLSRPFWRELQQVIGFSARARVRRSAAGVLLELCRYEHACGVWKPCLHVSSDTAIVQNIY